WMVALPSRRSVVSVGRERFTSTCTLMSGVSPSSKFDYTFVLPVASPGLTNGMNAMVDMCQLLDQRSGERMEGDDPSCLISDPYTPRGQPPVLGKTPGPSPSGRKATRRQRRWDGGAVTERCGRSCRGCSR